MNRRKFNYINVVFWLIWPVGVSLLIIFMFLTCSNKKEESKQPEIKELLQQKEKAFRLPEIPPMLTAAQDRAEYLITHYWDHFDFSDTTCIHLPEITEQAFVDYLDILPHGDKENAGRSIAAMLDRAVNEDSTGTMYAYFLRLYKDYLYDPNSPVRDEEYYIPVTQYIRKDTLSDEAVKSRAAFDLEMMLRNRKGSRAADFAFISVDGRKGTLHKLNSEYTILYFYNPDCNACKEATAFLRESSFIDQLLKDGILNIVAVYPDSDLSLWTKSKDKVPPLWLNVRDEPHIVKDKQLYDLKAIPSLYLLDKDKKVLLKDTPAEKIESYLHEKWNYII